MKWTPSSVFRDPTSGGTRANISLELSASKPQFRFTEPVTLKVTIKNHSTEEIPIGRLSPAYGDVRYTVRKPNGVIEQYRPPLYKCEVTKTVIPGGKEKTHLTSLAVGAQGFTFDTPGRYEFTAAIPDPSSGMLVISRPASIWVRYPDPVDEEVARRVFDRETGLFLYMAGGEHLEKGKAAMEEVAERYPDHPFVAHANLVLGLNEGAGQKSVVEGKVKRADFTEAMPYLKKALDSNMLPEPSQERLKATIDLYTSDEKGSKKSRKKS